MQEISILTQINYGQHERENLNIFLPKTQNTNVFVLLIHGGGWKGGCKEQYNLTGIILAEAGIPSATIGYRLLPEGTFPNSTHDILRAFQVLLPLSKEYGFHLDNIVTWGSSAGGHIALMLQAYQDKWKNDKIVPVIPNIVGTVAQCPVINFEDEWLQKAHRREYATDIGFEVLSPLHMDPQLFKSVFLTQGDADTTTPLTHAEAFIDKIKASGSKSQLLVVSGASHGYAYQAYNDLATHSIKKSIQYILGLVTK